MDSSKIETFPQLADWLVSYARSSSDQIVTAVDRALHSVFTIEHALPKPYQWHLRDQTNLDTAMMRAKDSRELNLILWENVARNIEAFQVTYSLKGIELLKSAVRSLNLREYVPSAVLARASVEHAVFATDKSTYVLKNIRLLQFCRKSVTHSPAFEEEIVKMTWGTRLENGEFQGLPRQSNCLNAIDRISKSPHTEHKQLGEQYAFLCDLTHPNLVGNARFWSEARGTDQEGRSVVEVTNDCDSPLVHAIIEHSLWAFSWSAGMIFQSFNDLNEAKVILRHKLTTCESD
jgi:hypothetical protein